jgi:hypothetical protein
VAVVVVAASVVVVVDEAPPELKAGLSLPFPQAARRPPVARTRTKTLRLAYFTRV